jgi:diacylglycerol kinase (ATP)
MKRWLRATTNSWNGLIACAETEAAFREEIALIIVAIPLAFILTPEAWKRMALLSPICLLLIIELLNTAIEILCDRISSDQDPKLGRVKDMGSAAIGLTLIWTLALWLVAVIDYFGF